MPLYEYRQNNSGGTWEAPALLVAIAAEFADEANKIARTVIDFDGEYCACCGPRWYLASDHCTIAPEEIDEYRHDEYYLRKSQEFKIPAVMVIA